MSGRVPAKDFDTERTENLYVVFVCTGNICRSPMAEVMFRDALEDAGLTPYVRVRSCGIGGWHIGQQADRRAIAELRNAGHDGSHHRAAQLSDKHRTADLFVAMDDGHVSDLVHRGVFPERIRLLRSFDPAAPEDAPVEDPYYGDQSHFAQTRTQIEAAIPGMLSWVRTMLASASAR